MTSHEKKYAPLISAFVDEGLEMDERESLEEHLKVCDRCSEVLRDFQALKKHGASLLPYAVNPFFLTRLHAKLRDTNARIKDSAVVEARLFVPLLVTLFLALIFLFSFSTSESSGATDDYLYFSGRRTLAEQQLLSHEGPISNDDVLMLSVTTTLREEPGPR
jgi:hypothetical protein